MKDYKITIKIEGTDASVTIKAPKETIAVLVDLIIEAINEYTRDEDNPLPF